MSLYHTINERIFPEIVNIKQPIIKVKCQLFTKNPQQSICFKSHAVSSYIFVILQHHILFCIAIF